MAASCPASDGRKSPARTPAKIHSTAATPIPQARAKRKEVRKASRTRSIRSAPPFWPVTAPMQADRAKSGTMAKASTRPATPRPPTAASPKRAMARPDMATVMATGLKMLEMQAGMPTRAMSDQWCQTSPRSSQSKSSSFSRTIRYQSTIRKVQAFAATVASAAPETPQPRPGNRPNTSSRMKIGSSTRLIAAAAIIMTLGITALPRARRILPATIGPTISTKTSSSAASTMLISDSRFTPASRPATTEIRAMPVWASSATIRLLVSSPSALSVSIS